MNDKNQFYQWDATPIPLSTPVSIVPEITLENLAARIIQLEIAQAALKAHLKESIDNHALEISLFSKSNDANLATLQKMQETLVLMNEVLVSYNKAKSFFSVFGSLGGGLIFISKILLSWGVLYVALKFGKLP